MEEEDSTSRGEDDPDQDNEKEVSSPRMEVEDECSGSSSTGPPTSHSVSTRQARNQAEKNRRDKLNAYINQLSTLVPIINYSPKKLDKTSILRLAATYIRLHNVVFGNPKNSSQQNSRTYLPEFLSSINWSEDVLEGIGGGMLLIVTGAGKIIFVSNAVEKILGHTQIELMGHSLFSLTCLEDHGELRRNLSPDDTFPTSTLIGDVGSADDSDSNCSSRPPTPPRLEGFDISSDSSSDVSSQRRSFYIRLRQRAVSKSDNPHYDLVHIVGHLRVPTKKFPQPSTSRKRDQPTNSNDIVLVAVARPFKEKRLTYLSLAEAYREEFITRHAVDGNIIYTDHRISTVSGYLAEEVVGVPGFKFMHKDDMRWTMIALRQMYYRGSSYGSSVYRLQSKTGEFIYIKTHGYLEITEASDDVQSFLCINTLVSEEEGCKLILKMKDLYAPLIHDKLDGQFSLIVENRVDQNFLNELNDNSLNVLEEPLKINIAIQQMLTNIPPFHPPVNISGLELEDLRAREKFAQVQMLAKTMPSVNEQAAKLGIDIKPLSHSRSFSTTVNQIHSLKSSIPNCTPAVNQLNRPSVLRHASRHNEVSVVKRLKTNDHRHSVSDMASSDSDRDVSNLVCTSDVIVENRKLDEGIDCMQTINKMSEPELSLPSPTFNYQQPPPQAISSFNLPQTEMDNNNPLLEIFHFSEFEHQIDVSDYELHHLNQAGSQVWEKPEKLETELHKSHYNLGSNFEMQETQISAIEQTIESVPDKTDQLLNNSMRLSELKAELKKEKQTLLTICQDHQSIYNME